MRRGQHQWWLLNRQYNIQKGGFDKKGRIDLKRSSLIERVVFDVILRHIVTREERRTAGDA